MTVVHPQLQHQKKSEGKAVFTAHVPLLAQSRAKKYSSAIADQKYLEKIYIVFHDSLMPRK